MSLFLLQLNYVQLEGAELQKLVFVCYLEQQIGRANKNCCAITQVNILYFTVIEISNLIKFSTYVQH